MASLTTDPNGHKRVGIETPDGRRCTVRLGAMPDRTAQEFRDNIEHLRVNWHTPHLIATKVLQWANGLDDKLYSRIARAGLLPPRTAAAVVTLKAFLDDVFASLHVKDSTRIFYGHTRRCLLDHFGESRDIATIGPREADQFHSWLATHDFCESGSGKPRVLSPATVSRRLLLARHTFNKALRWNLLEKNPFAGIRAGRQVNAARKMYVPRQTIRQVIDAVADPQFRLMLALSRYGGLRCPSEHLSLRWQDVDWAGGRITVHSPKTEHHADGEFRVIPLFADLAPYLREVFEQAQEGAVFVITAWRSLAINLRTKLLRTLKGVGIKPWPRLWHNLRASCETDLARAYPLVTVAEWLGHNPAVMVENYLTNPDIDSHFKSAAGMGEGGGEAEGGASDCASLSQNARETREIVTCSNPSSPIPPTNKNPDSSVNPAKNAIPEGVSGSDLPSNASISPQSRVGLRVAFDDPDLAAVAWKTLSAEARANITAIVKREGGEA